MIPRLNLLFSYAFLRTGAFGPDPVATVRALGPAADVLIDSGAFSVYTDRLKAAVQGRPPGPPLTVGNYSRFCAQVAGHVFQYIALDVISDPEGTRANLAAMVRAGLRPMPVFVEGMPFTEMPQLTAINPWVCVTCVEHAPLDYQRARFARAYREAGGQAHLHALGFVRHPDLFQLPLASVDSSSYTAGSRWGTCFTYDERGGLQALKRRAIWSGTGDRAAREAVIGRARLCGLTLAELGDPACWRGNHGAGALLTIFAYLQFHAHAAAHGRRLFLAVVNAHWLKPIAAVMAAMDGDGQRFDWHAARAWLDGPGARGGMGAIEAVAEVLGGATAQPRTEVGTDG